MIKLCVICGKPFEARAAKACGEECRIEKNRRYNASPKVRLKKRESELRNRASNRVKRNAQRRAHYAAHREQGKTATRTWRRLNKDRYVDYQIHYSSILKGSPRYKVYISKQRVMKGTAKFFQLIDAVNAVKQTTVNQ